MLITHHAKDVSASPAALLVQLSRIKRQWGPGKSEMITSIPVISRLLVCIMLSCDWGIIGRTDTHMHLPHPWMLPVWAHGSCNSFNISVNIACPGKDMQNTLDVNVANPRYTRVEGRLSLGHLMGIQNTVWQRILAAESWNSNQKPTLLQNRNAERVVSSS